MRSRRPLCAALALWILAIPGAASAQELRLALDSECEEAPVAEAVERRLGRGLAQTDAPLDARVALRREGGGVRVVVGLTRDGARSERAWRADDCAAAVRSAALVLALALDPEASPIAEPALIEQPATIEEPATIAEPASTPTAEASAAIEPAERPPGLRPGPTPEPAPELVRVGILAGALIDAGSLPGAQAGARLGVELSLLPDGALRLGLDVTYLSAARARASEPGASVDVTLGYGSLRVGAMASLTAAGPGALRLGGAAELMVGVAHGLGAGARLQGAQAAILPYVAARAVLAVELTLVGPLALRVTGAVGAVLVAPTFEVRGIERVRPSDDALVEGAALAVWNFS